MGILDLLKGGMGSQRGTPQPLNDKETRSYEQIMDEITEWHINHTDILEVLRKEVEEERLSAWSKALETGIRKGLITDYGKVEESPLFPIYLDLYRFVKEVRKRLLMNPTMKNMKEMVKMDSLSLCIICGIRTLQKERGAKRLINTLQWKLLERYLGRS